MKAVMIKKSIILFAVCCLAALLSALVYFSFTDRAENIIPVMNTLSSEQLAGLGYTSASSPDDNDIWEDDGSPRSARTSDPKGSPEVSVSFPIDINTASAEELMNINGIGSTTAEKIISYRNEHGNFLSEEELLNVDGIGSKKLSDIKDYIYIDPEIIARPAETTAIPDSSLYESGPETVTVAADGGTGFLIDLNTASADELMSIDGVGESTAEAIIEYANTAGFDDITDLMNIPGIGEKRFEAIAPYVCVRKANTQSDSSDD